MRRTLLLFGVLILANSQFVHAQTTEEKAGENQDRRWGLAASVFERGVGEIAISKKLSRKTMLLLSTTISLSDATRKSENEGRTTEDFTRDYSLTVGPEWRRYNNHSAKMAIYYGIQPIFGYTRLIVREVVIQPVSREESEQKQFTISAGFNISFGVEYEVLKNLSLSVHLRPLSYLYSKREPDNDSFVLKSNRLTFSQNAALFVRMYF